MTTPSLQDRVSQFVGRTVAEPKTSGIPNSDIEVTALFESILLSIMTEPRTVLQLALWARNGLVKAIDDELASITALINDLADIENTTFAIDSTEDLVQMRTLLLQMEKLNNLT